MKSSTTAATIEANGDGDDEECGCDNAQPTEPFDLRTATVNAESVTRVVHNDTEHIVAEVVAARAMELNGGYVPGEEFEKSVSEWEHTPLPIGHPMLPDGTFVTARIPEVIENSVVGYFQHVDYDDELDALVGEIWVNIAKARALGAYGERIVEVLESGEPLEVSTAYRADYGAPGVYDGEFRETVRVNLRPDHLALLPDDLGPGKCSVEDGCGVNAPTTPETATATATAAPAAAANSAYGGVVVGVSETPPAPVCLNTAADLGYDDHAPVDTERRTLAQRLLDALGVPVASLLGDGDDQGVTYPEDSPDSSEPSVASEDKPTETPANDEDSTEPPTPPSNDQNTDTDTPPDAPTNTDTETADAADDESEDATAAGDPDPEQAAPEEPEPADTDQPPTPTPTSTTDMKDTIEALVNTTDFTAEELEALDDDIVTRLADTLLNACECGKDDCDDEHDEAPEAESAPEPEPNADEAEADEATDEIAATVDELAATVSTLATTVEELAADRNEAEQEERAGFVEAIQSNTDDVYTDEELAEMSLETLEKTASLVSNAEESTDPTDVPAPVPTASGTDLSALKPIKAVNTDADADADLPSAGSLAEYRRRKAQAQAQE